MSKHEVVHIEIPASNAKEAGQFYADLFGWNVQTDEKIGQRHLLLRCLASGLLCQQRSIVLRFHLPYP